MDPLKCKKLPTWVHKQFLMGWRDQRFNEIHAYRVNPPHYRLQKIGKRLRHRRLSCNDYLRFQANLLLNLVLVLHSYQIWSTDRKIDQKTKWHTPIRRRKQRVKSTTIKEGQEGQEEKEEKKEPPQLIR